ncbi:1-deoxy-D-xylulose 5-phosphate reductoisomerase [Candidatus Pelagibacter sp. RS39]|uniref:1-deoxy-D-xylulose 5-phosphate reductoisomerase n=1 Tax=Candidatus Pelagibacter sp. RS39 TaxID=1977864 RepID=UPI000A14DBC1|nr:1-deoxy-D-xylulose 5-phosphate reductoisomerase [Candidatus Pelagibacter sp. RS39]ARJ47788.1 1-deoxy-D-xylulose 5-phosphate reductoisomerase [Candidatus Pelagibacter sp. RS39]
MKKKIAILGSTSSIGKCLLNIIKKDKKNFKIELLTANTNYKDLIAQALKFNVKNIIITDLNCYKKTKILCKNKKINIFQNFESLKRILPKKVDYVMSAISGIGGLLPTYKIINRTKIIAIANKEAIVCGWPLIKKELKKNKTKFIPVDSEHFSIFSLLNDTNKNDVEKIFITASGGPFINLPKNQFKKIKLIDALKHPNWSMGKKITIDSATLMNKVFEVIEAKNIFDIGYDKISILTHPKSYVHTIIKFKNGLSKFLIHEPDMTIPIYNSIYFEKNKNIESSPLDFNILNNLNLQKVEKNKFPLVNILDKLPKYSSLFETVLITINDYLVYKFLDRKIDFHNLTKLINKISNLKEFQKYKKIKPKNIKQIYNLRDYVHLKLNALGI